MSATTTTRPAATSRRPATPARRRLIVWALRAGLIALILAVWLFATRPGGVSALIVPTPANVAASVAKFAVQPNTWVQAAITLGEMVAAFALAAVVGIVVGFILSRSQRTAAAFEPLFAWGYLMPFALLYPLFLLWLGVGPESKVFYAAAGAFFPIAYNTMRGLRSVDARYLNVGKAYGAGPLAVDIVIKAGAARPMILSGLRVGLSIVTISVVLAELLGSNMGLGHEIEMATSRLRTADAYGLVVILLVVTGGVQTAVERLLSPRAR